MCSSQHLLVNAKIITLLVSANLWGNLPTPIITHFNKQDITFTSSNSVHQSVSNKHRTVCCTTHLHVRPLASFTTATLMEKIQSRSHMTQKTQLSKQTINTVEKSYLLCVCFFCSTAAAAPSPHSSHNSKWTQKGGRKKCDKREKTSHR